MIHTPCVLVFMTRCVHICARYILRLYPSARKINETAVAGTSPSAFAHMHTCTQAAFALHRHPQTCLAASRRHTHLLFPHTVHAHSLYMLSYCGAHIHTAQLHSLPLSLHAVLNIDVLFKSPPFCLCHIPSIYTQFLTTPSGRMKTIQQ